MDNRSLTIPLSLLPDISQIVKTQVLKMKVKMRQLWEMNYHFCEFRKKLKNKSLEGMHMNKSRINSSLGVCVMAGLCLVLSTFGLGNWLNNTVYADISSCGKQAEANGALIPDQQTVVPQHLQIVNVINMKF